MKQYDNIEELLKKFYEGETSGEEEETLYAYFGSGDVAPHLGDYTPLFGFHEAALHNVVVKFDEPAETRPYKTYRHTYPAAIAAACILLVALLLPGPSPLSTNEEADPFEGSYMIVNGEKITDMEILRPEIEKTVALTLMIRQEIEAVDGEVTQLYMTYEQFTDN